MAYFKQIISLLAAAFLFSGAALAAGDVDGPEQRGTLCNLKQTKPAIQTREDLLRYISDQSDGNPLNKLSSAARYRLLDSLILNSRGQISSYMIADIKSELSPPDAFAVLELFGDGQVAIDIYGESAVIQRADTGARRSCKISQKPIKPTGVSEYYCNGGYCTANSSFICKPSACNPP